MAQPSERRRHGQVRSYPKAPEASLERLQQLAGIIELKRPAPSHKFLDDEARARPTRRARD